MKKVFTSFSSQQTKEIGKRLAEKLMKKQPQKQRGEKTALVIALQGDLGGGKTTFLQGFARGLGVKKKILSPTFVIIKRFEIRNSRFKNFYHIDCYRLEKPEELLELGFKNIISDPKNIVVVEWADKIKKVLPREIVLIKFELLKPNQRKILVTIPTDDEIHW